MEYLLVCTCFEDLIVMAKGTLKDISRIKHRTYGVNRHYKIITQQQYKETQWEF